MTPAQVTASLNQWEATLTLSTDPWADVHNLTDPRPDDQEAIAIASENDRGPEGRHTSGAKSHRTQLGRTLGEY